MKVVLFCGGLGTRMREYSESIPKPMIPIGYRPMLWHVMKYYAHFGHTEFILCLGYRGDVIKQYFLNYDECLSNDFVLANGGKDLRLYSRDLENWKITFVDTGLSSNVGQRLRAVEPFVDGDQVFLANYSDGLTDLYLPEYLAHFDKHEKIGSFLCVRPNQTFHVVSVAEDGLVRDIRHVAQAGVWINGGFFIFKKEIFNYIREAEDLVEEPFRRLIAEQQLIAFPYAGFWACMDTFKEKKLFDDMNVRGDTPWEVWKRHGGARSTEIPGSPSPRATERLGTPAVLKRTGPGDR